MKKSVLAVAVGAAMAMANAANADVSVYGKAHVSVDSLNNGDKSYLYVSSNSSRIGFKATEDLDGGMKLGFLAEQTIKMDGTGTKVFDRETYLNLGGGFGSAAIGKIDTPMKGLGRKIDFFGDQIGDSRNLIAQSSAGVGYDARPDNMIAYTTPDMSGISATVAYMPDDGTKNASGFDLAGNYTGGPLFVGFAYESHGKGMNGTATESESGVRLGASYALGDLKFAGLFESLTNIAGVKDKNTTVLGAGASYKLGAGSVKGQLYNAAKYKDTSKTGAMMIALGYDYTLSKNTWVYAAYAVTNNDANAKYSEAGAGHGTDPGAFAVGKDPKGLSFGVVTKF